jgi:hypothetical protein
MSKLGFSVACHKGDLPLVRGCLASIREFAPDAPVCLITDGDFSTRKLEQVFNIQVMRRKDVKNKALRHLSYGYGISKMVAFWEAPFEIVLHVDADAVLWGDVRTNLPPFPWDVVFNEPHEIITPHIQNTQYFDPDKIFNYIEKFPWQGNPFFNTGVICVRKNSLDLDEYIRMLELQRKFTDIFMCGEQGILNILVFRAVQAGKIKAKSAHLQSVVPSISKEQLETRFKIKNGVPQLLERPTVVHWAGAKPWFNSKEIFSTPMDYFRQKAMLQCGVPKLIPTNAALAADEIFSRILPRKLRGAKHRLKRLIGG